jgi:hypothetical protein
VIAASAAGAISAFAIVSTVRHFLKLRRLRPVGQRALEDAVRRSDREAIVGALDALFPGGWSPALADALATGSGSAGAVAELNEQLGDLDHELRVGEAVSKSATRTTLFAGSFGAIVELLPTVGAAHPDYAPAVAAVGFGIIGAAVCGEFGRRSRERVGDLRTEWDHVTAVFVRRFGTNSEAPPRRPRRR